VGDDADHAEHPAVVLPHPLVELAGDAVAVGYGEEGAQFLQDDALAPVAGAGHDLVADVVRYREGGDGAQVLAVDGVPLPILFRELVLLASSAQDPPHPIGRRPQVLMLPALSGPPVSGLAIRSIFYPLEERVRHLIGEVSGYADLLSLW